MKSDIFKVDLKNVQTNILILYMDQYKVDTMEFLERLTRVQMSDTVRVILRGMCLAEGCVRFIFHHNISDTDVEYAIKKTQLVILEYHAKIKLNNV